MRQYSSFLPSLEGNPLFAGLHESQIAALFAPDAAPVSHTRGDILFCPAKKARALAILIQSTAQVYKAGLTEKRLLMSRLSPGDTFGMASLLYEKEDFPTEVQAEKACQVLYLGKDWLLSAFEKEPRIAINYITLLSERIHFLTHRIEALRGDDLPARLLSLLQSHRQTAGSDAFMAPFSMSQLAEMLGVGRASLYRALDALAMEGILRHEGRQIVFLSPCGA